MRVLVTGGSGFIGSHVVDKLRARGHDPVIYDLRPSPWHSDPAHPVETVLGSITDREALERALHSCDAVAHLAAVADVNDVHASPEDAERINARGTVAVLEAARRAGVKRIVYASTIWVYSDTESDEVDEETLLPPPSPPLHLAPSWPASCTARATRSCTGSTTRSSASGSRTVPEPARQRLSRRSSTRRLPASR